MSPSTAKIIFKITGVIQVLFGLILLCSSILGLVSLSYLSQGNQMLTSYGIDTVTAPSLLLTVLSVGVSVVCAIMYGVSAYGFFMLKKWQPMLFAFVVFLSIISIFVNFVTTGFQLLSILSVFALVVWVALLFLVYSNKKLFTK